MSTIRLPSRSRRWPLIVIGVLVLLAILFTALSGAVVDLLWYREIGHSSVFWTTIRTKFLLGLVFGLLFFGLLYANLVIARRIRPTTRIMTPDQEVLARVRDASDPYLRWLVPVGAAILALLVGIGVSGEWKTFLLWRGGSGVLFGNPDPAVPSRSFLLHLHDAVAAVPPGVAVLLAWSASRSSWASPTCCGAASGRRRRCSPTR